MTDKGGNLLNFDTAMAHFQAMFPGLSASLIESVLRKHDGNVAQTIEELLERSAGNCASSSSSTGNWTANVGEEEDWVEAEKKRLKAKGDGQGTAPRPPPARDPCADDEKIALLIQNREFLRYLRHDAHFQRAMIGQHQASARHVHRYTLPPGPRLPLLLSSSRPSRSPNSTRLFHRQSGRKAPGVEEMPEPVPDGPVLEQAERNAETAIPEGPLIDYVDAEGRESGWAGRIKAKLAKRAPEGSEQLPPSPLVHFSDKQMQQGVHGVLARGGKGLLEGLARKFSARKQRIRMEGAEERAEERGGRE